MGRIGIDAAPARRFDVGLSVIGRAAAPLHHAVGNAVGLELELVDASAKRKRDGRGHCPRADLR